MYLADATGYLGYCGVMIARSLFEPGGDFLPFFLSLSTVVLSASLVLTAVSIIQFTRRFPRHRA
jgi:hypothetical protein